MPGSGLLSSPLTAVDLGLGQGLSWVSRASGLMIGLWALGGSHPPSFLSPSSPLLSA